MCVRVWMGWGVTNKMQYFGGEGRLRTSGVSCQGPPALFKSADTPHSFSPATHSPTPTTLLLPFLHMHFLSDPTPV